MTAHSLRRYHATYGYRTFLTTRKVEQHIRGGPRWNPRKYKRALRTLLDIVKVPTWLPFTKTPPV